MPDRPSFELELQLESFTLRAQHDDPVEALAALGQLLGVDVSHAFEDEAHRWRQQHPGGVEGGAETPGDDVSGATGPEPGYTPPEALSTQLTSACQVCGTSIPYGLAELTINLTARPLCAEHWRQQ